MTMLRVRFPTWIPAAMLGICPAGGFAWEPGYPTDAGRMASRNLSLNTQNRDDVVAFWHAVYQASEGYQKRVGWTGDFPNKPGATSAAFVSDVERRIHFFRAMAGLPTDARVNSGARVVIWNEDRFKPAANITKEEASQRMALMIVASYNAKTGSSPGMSHDPNPDVPSWSAAAWNAASKSNLAFGSYGPGAVDEYAVEELLSNAATSTWNSLVGHRRWMLVPDATDFATGDYPGESATRPPTNVLYVMQHKEEVAALPEPPFVRYPSEGYFPAMLNSRFWSLSRKGADFSSATVTMTDAAGNQVPITALYRDTSYGDPALIWQVNEAAAARTVEVDRRFRVTVQGIQGAGVPGSLAYDVILINPDALRRVSPISGPDIAKPGSTVKLRINPIAGNRKTRVTEYQRVNKAWTEGGEGAQADVVDGTSPVYPLLATSAGQKGAGAISGKLSFNLTFPESYDLIQRAVPTQTLELGPWLHTRTGSELKFLYRRGLMSDASTLVVEVTSDLGDTWQTVGSAIKGYADARPDTNTLTASYQLPISTKPLRVRFRYFYQENGGGLTTYVDFSGLPTGIFLDDIRLVKCDRLLARKTRETDKTTLLLQVPENAVPGDRWAFGMESEFGGPWLQTGPFKPLRIVK